MWPHGYAGFPREPVALPARVEQLAGGAALTAVWKNALGGITFSARSPQRSAHNDDRFIKWCAIATGDNLAAEAERLQWAAKHGATVPTVIESGEDAEGSWLVTAAIEAESAVSEIWRENPRTAALAIGAGLRQFHDRMPVNECPFEWTVVDRMAAAKQRVQQGNGPESWSREHQHLTVFQALELIQDIPALDPVVCHGDACAPNTLMNIRGEFAGHVDLGSLGVADRWADLAVASWSTVWNYGAGYEDYVYQGYGIEADPVRIGYYRLLWDMS